MKILVADDDATSLRSLAALLQRDGYEVVTASDGQQAWSVLNGPEPIAIAILDWTMPALSGVELCRKIREQDSRGYRYVMLVTGRASAGDVVEGLEAGADDFIAKPFFPPEILARVRAAARILERHRGPERRFQSVLDEALRSHGGEIVVRAGDLVGRVWVHRGRIAWAYASSETGSFRDELEDAGSVDDQRWEMLVQSCRRTGANFFEALVASRMVTAEAVEASVSRYIARRLRAIARLPAIEAVFLPKSHNYTGPFLFAPDGFMLTDEHTAPSEAPVATSTDAPAPASTPAPAPLVGAELGAIARELLALDGALTVAVIDLDASGAVWSSDGAGVALDGRALAQARALRSLDGADLAREMVSLAGGVWHMLVRVPEMNRLCLYMMLQEGHTLPARARLALHEAAARWPWRPAT